MKRNLYLLFKTIWNIIYEYADNILLVVTIIISLFIGIWTSMNLTLPPVLTAEEFQHLKVIAQKVVDNERDFDSSGVKIEILENYKYITVYLKNGHVEATNFNGNLSFKEVNKRDVLYIPSILLGILFSIIVFILFLMIHSFVTKLINTIKYHWKETKREYNKRNE